MPPASTDTTITTLPGGTAQISLRRLRDSVGQPSRPPSWSPRRGTNTTATRYGFRVPSAQRTVAQYAVWTPATFDIDAAFTSLSGFDKNGASGAMDGNDACAGAACRRSRAWRCPRAPIPGNMNPINGNPDNVRRYIGTPGPTGTAKDAVRIDWAGIKTGASLPPDFTYPTNSWPNPYPDEQLAGDPGERGPVAPGGSTDGKGILIVTGDLTLSGS